MRADAFVIAVVVACACGVPPDGGGLPDPDPEPPPGALACDIDVHDLHPLVGFCLPARIDADAPCEVTTLSGRCLGSSCTDVHAPLCDVVVDGADVDIGGSVCVSDNGDDACSEDCSGGDGGVCVVPGLAAGAHTLRSSAGSLTITIPYVADATACVAAE